MSDKLTDIHKHRQERLMHAYSKACSDPDLFTVISDIFSVCGVFRSPGYERMREADIAEGMRRVGLHIISRLDGGDEGLFADFLKKHMREKS